MTEVTEENERARDAALKRLQAVHTAYVALFGTLAEPTEYGRAVLADLDTFCTTYSESIHMDREGRIDPFTTIYRDGKKAVALRIRQMIDWSDHGNSSSDPDGQ